MNDAISPEVQQIHLYLLQEKKNTTLCKTKQACIATRYEIFRVLSFSNKDRLVNSEWCSFLLVRFFLDPIIGGVDA